MQFDHLQNVTFPQLFFKHFSSKNQLPGLSVSGTLVENGLNKSGTLKTFFRAKISHEYIKYV